MPPPPQKKFKEAHLVSAASALTSTPLEGSADALDEQFELEPAFTGAEPGPEDEEHDDVGDESSYHVEWDRQEEAHSPGHDQPVDPMKRATTGDSVLSQAPAKASKRKRQPGEQRLRADVQSSGDVSSARAWVLPPVNALDRLMQAQRRALPKLSALELDELRLQESFMLDTSAVEERASLLSFIRDAMPTLPATLAKPTKKEGSPRLLVIAGSALRVADLCREVKPYKAKTGGDIAKLFAKHFKLSEHVEYLRQHKVSIAVGTPNRIAKLLSENDALSLNHLSHLILDVTHLDAKQRSLIDLPEACGDLFQSVLGNRNILDRLRAGRMKIVCY